MKTKVISEDNKLAQMFNLDICRNLIKHCPKDETIILLPHYSINRPQYTEEEFINDSEQWDFYELEQYLNCPLIVSDYDDLCADPHNLLSL